MQEKHIIKVLSKVAESIEPISGVRLAAALVYRNEIISIGTNKKKSHPFQKKFASNEDAIFLHAETDAIYNALRKYSTDVVAKAKLYVCRVKWSNDQKENHIQGLAKPCPGCQRAISTFNIKHVCYTLDEKGLEYL
jgi:deoxycytidylate deaminase